MIYPFFRPLLFALDPETAHDMAFASLDVAAKLGIVQALAPRPLPSPVTAMGLRFPNRVGLAAGLDKNAAHIDGLAALGFGFIECGTVTPRPQPGNPTPRLFRLPEAEALVNRLGFNNDGVERFLANVGARVVARHPRPQHRQELRHAERARRRRLSRLPARRLRPRVVRHRQHLVAEHEGPARPAIGGSARGVSSARSRRSRRRFPTGTASTRRSPSRSRPI